MSDNPRLRHLLDELLDSQATPEDVCRSCPELLPEVRTRWQAVCRIRSELDALFPVPALKGAGAPAPWPEGAALPQVSGHQVEAVIGHGGVGVVYRAWHLRLHRPVALKMLLAGAHAQSAERERLLREAEAVAGLSHPNIVQVYEVGDVDGRPYFTMELVEGGSLAQKLAGAPQPAGRAAALLVPIAEAVRVAHEGGIVHRDLKPGNILLTPDGTPKVSDFGLARRLESGGGLTLSGEPVGTPSYMAPEQARGQRDAIGPATDVYALGAILYELLTGRPPFRAGVPLETLRQVLADEPVPPSRLNPGVPRDLETVCLKCLEKEPQRRYASARALAEDLRRYLLGQVVVARPVGRLTKVGKWVRRNPAVASLSAAAAVALAAGTVASWLLALEARRQADLATKRTGELEQQAIDLQAQTTAAQQNARRAEANENEMRRVLVAGLLLTIERNPHALSSPLEITEADALHKLREADAPVRLQLLETALSDPETARRVGRRADWVAQAVVGCDRALRADVARLLVRRIQEPGAPHDVRLACVRLGLAVNLREHNWGERSADTLLVELNHVDPQSESDEYLPLAEALVAVIGRLPTTRGADHAARALDIFLTRLREPADGTVTTQLGKAVVAISPRSDAAAAARAAEAFGTLIRQSDSTPSLRLSLAVALAAICQRLPPSEAAAHVARAVDFLIEDIDATKEKDKFQLHWKAEALGALCGRLDAARASRAAAALITILGDSFTLGESKVEFLSHRIYPAVLTRVAERLDAPGSLRSAEDLVLVLGSSSGNIRATIDELRVALVALCGRLDATGAARVGEALAAAARDPKTPVLVRTLLADGLVALADRIAPDQAASLESTLVDTLLPDLANAKSLPSRATVGQALATACTRPGARCAARATEALAAALRDPQTLFTSRKPLAAALAGLIGQLPPKEAASRANQAVDALDALWAARTAPLDRASVAEALVAVWARLDPADAAARAKRVAADLEGALRDSKTTPNEMAFLAKALAAVYYHLGPAERSGRANAAADTLVAALRRPKNPLATITQLSEALGKLCAHLDRAGAVRTADAVLAVIDDPGIQSGIPGLRSIPGLDRFALHEALFKNVVARLDERDLQRLLGHPLAAGRFQRVLLDSLGGSKNRSFRNTWDYLDGTESNGMGTDLPSPGTSR
jgi:hypothetical protein